jgi:hypothetical protein
VKVSSLLNIVLQRGASGMHLRIILPTARFKSKEKKTQFVADHAMKAYRGIKIYISTHSKLPY